jgi:hypothetical protein
MAFATMYLSDYIYKNQNEIFNWIDENYIYCNKYILVYIVMIYIHDNNNFTRHAAYKWLNWVFTTIYITIYSLTLPSVSPNQD